MISDSKALKGTKLTHLFDNFQNALTQSGSVWKYNRKSITWTAANGFDKFFTEKMNEYALSLNGKQSVLAHKSVLDVVRPHTNNPHVLLTDLKGYYESISYESVSRYFERAEFSTGFINHIRIFYFDDSGFLRRGLRGSAIISELIGLKIDNEIQKLLYETDNLGVTYSRFYDDMPFSFNNKSVLRDIELALDKIFKDLDLEMNKDKTKIKDVQNSLLLGLRIYKGTITVPKKYKKIVRARVHTLSRLHIETNWDDEYEVRELKRFTGHVIGSLWYIIKNSDEDTSRYIQKIEDIKSILSECDSAIEEIKSDAENVFFDY